MNLIALATYIVIHVYKFVLDLKKDNSIILIICYVFCVFFCITVKTILCQLLSM